MDLEATPLDGAFVVHLDVHADERGWFARTYCADELRELGIDFEVVQANASFNARRGTLRGMHFQVPPRAERKLVRCTRGAVYDVVVDLRPDSKTYRAWHAVELREGEPTMLYVPEGFAQGFQTLEDETELSYLMSERYSPEHARGVRWDDPAFGIEWPDGKPTISERDHGHPDFR
jgi:dTDP-4-dehydrorhamnose 3,5-epimerase